jgi:hypothetical protein
MLLQYKNGIFISHNKAAGLSDNPVLALFEASDGSIWIGARDYARQFKDGTFKHISGEAPVLQSTVRQICEDQEGNILLATVLGSGVAFLDGTVVNVALPAIAEDLDASTGDLQWVVNAYLVTLSAFVLLGGSLGDRYGRKRVFLLGLAGFTGASLLCGLAPNIGILIGARVPRARLRPPRRRTISRSSR